MVSMDLTIFPSTWEKYTDLIEVDAILCVEGRVDKQNGDVKIIVDRVRQLEMPTISELDDHLPQGDQVIPTEVVISDTVVHDDTGLSPNSFPEVVEEMSMTDGDYLLSEDTPPAELESMRAIDIPAIHETPAGYAPRYPQDHNPLHLFCLLQKRYTWMATILTC